MTAFQELILFVVVVYRNLVFQVPLSQVCVTLAIDFCSTICQFDFGRSISVDIVAGSTRKSKLKAVITGVTSGAFVLLVLGAIFMYRSYRVRRSKHDVYVDVEGIYDFSSVPVFLEHLM